MKVTETISIVFSLLAVVSSFYAVWVSKKQNDQKVKIELLQETLKKLELAKELLTLNIKEAQKRYNYYK